MKGTFTLIFAAAALVAVLLFSSEMLQSVDANEIVVIQSPTGNIAVYTTPGIRWQGFGRVTTYLKRNLYEFEMPVRFNDGGHANMKGSIQYELPLDEKSLIELYTKFTGADAVQAQLVQTVVSKSVYMTGPLMSSKESYAEKRNSLIHYVEDQVERGVYQTRQREIRVKDPITGAEKTATEVEIVLDDKGLPRRQEEATLQVFGIKPFNFSISSLDYDSTVEKQIQSQQQIAMSIQTAIADAKRAEQGAITAEQQGKAQAAKAKWDQEVIKAKVITEAQQNMEKAELDVKTAELEKTAKILRGQGEAEQKRLVMSADGALEKKLNAWVEVNKNYAASVAAYKGNWVPLTVMGGSSSSNGANDLVSLLTAKTAKDLSLDLSIQK